MGIASSYAAGKRQGAPKPKRSLMPMINKLQGMKKPKKSRRVVVSAPKKKPETKPEPAKSKGANLASNKGKGLANPKRM